MVSFSGSKRKFWIRGAVWEVEMGIVVKRRQCFSWIFASLLVVGAVASTNAMYGAPQASPASPQESQQTRALPAATTDDGKFTVTVKKCERSYDAVQLKKNRVDCTVLIENKTEGVLKVYFDWKPPIVLLTDDTGTQTPIKFANVLDADGGDANEGGILVFDPHVPVSRHWVFVGASEDSKSASLIVGFLYGSAVAVGLNGGSEHLVVRNIPLPVR